MPQISNPMMAALLAAACFWAGCAGPQQSLVLTSAVSARESLAADEQVNLVFPERLAAGYTLVLPGIVGRATLDHGIVLGLKMADVPTAVELYDWTQSWIWPVRNLSDFAYNRIEARKIAAKIVRYQDRFPGRPVYLLGYSGGGGMAALTLEALPAERRITRALFLAPTLAPDYDLRAALERTQGGIVNFYSPLDAPILMVMGTAIGTTERRHTVAAGAVGFDVPATLDAPEREAYRAQLTQYPYDLNMIFEGHVGGHFGWVSPPFIAHHVAPLITTGAATDAQVADSRAH